MIKYYSPYGIRPRGQRLTLADRIRMRKARKRKEREWKPVWG